MDKMKRFYLILLATTATLLVRSACMLGAQSGQNPAEAVSLSVSSRSTYYQVERSNWSKYVNGKYVGLTHRETRANVSCKGQDSRGVRFSGFFYVLEETLKDMMKSAQGIDATVSADFTLAPNGRMTFAEDDGFPQLRDFPSFPDSPVKIGSRWQTEAFRSVDPKNNGRRTTITILVDYLLSGQETYRGENVYRIKAKYATRYDKFRKTKKDDPTLENATGTHDADILVESETGAVLLILDRMDETFFYADGTSVRFKGNTAIFTDYPVLIDRKNLIAKATDIGNAGSTPDNMLPESDRMKESEPVPPPAADTPKTVTDIGETATKESAENKAFAVEETPQGVRLSVRDLRFEADSDAILPVETWRLDAIAKALTLVKEGHFLVEGHTASVGKTEGEKALSVQRAKKVVDELVKRGLRAEQFIYSGYGGTKPIADNATAEGRAQNRRVEITIME
jgi:outer membrane protein OmpA-like peptidoglycan-associated protein